MTDLLPSVFIGSSVEGLGVAREVELQLQRDAITTIWKNGVFGRGTGTLGALMHALDQFDFAIMILSPDDMIESRDQSYASPRDNVLFELGLFMGRLGPSRVFIVHAEDANLRLPSDLAGVTLSPYRRRDDLSAVLSPTCTPIIKAIQALGFSENRAQQQIRRLEDRQEKLSKLLFLTSQVALKGIVTKFELEKLRGLSGHGPFPVRYHPRMYDELRRLYALQFVAPTEGHEIGDMKSAYARQENLEFDLKQFVYLTDDGQVYLSLLEDLMRLTATT
jgi:CAP12/Pycsar effector protein, TIR domain